MYDLKPCPFCGGTNIRVDKCTCMILCLSCFCKGPNFSKYLSQCSSEVEAAVLAWNTRKSDNP